jgi:hypothetical protein
MLSLDSTRWHTLWHAYGNASDIPKLLRRLEGLPASANNEEPWYSIWSALAHQGDVYSASFAAVPHVVSYLATAPMKADFSFFQFPAWVEICRSKQGIEVPTELAPAYREAMAKLPGLVAAAAGRDWDENILTCTLGAIAASKGFCVVAEAILELSSDTAQKFLKWHLDP